VKIPYLHSPFSSKKHFSFARYFPKNLVYFYAFPSGESSQFYNQVSTFEEELVSRRPLVCAGGEIKVITFAASSDEFVLEAVSKGVDIIDKDNIIRLPKEISPDKKGKIRNELIKEALQNLVKDDQLVMAQPFIDRALEKKFKIHPLLSVGVNDKRNKYIYIPDEYLPEKYAAFDSGKDFYQDNSDFPYPCVVKVTSSSSGDGVGICKNVEDIEKTKNRFASVQGSIIVEEYINIAYNIGIQFGIPFNRDIMPEILGFSEQLTSNNGEFFGGVVNPTKHIPYFEDIEKVFFQEIFPRIRSYGWYGVGGIDVLIGTNGKFYFIDPNFRMTAMSAYIYLSNVNKLTMPTISFSGNIECSQITFENNIVSLTKGKDAPLKIISLAQHKNIFRFNAGIQFESNDDLRRKAVMLHSLGVKGKVLKNIIESPFNYKIF
jgi:hypothetical protein